MILPEDLLFPSFDPTWIWDAIFELCYSQHGGSGLSFTRSDVLDMDLDEIDHHLTRLERRRKQEADAMKKATKR